MNVQISTFVDFSGPIDDLDPLLDAICDAVVQCGYGSEESDDSIVKSVVTVSASRLTEYEDAGAFLVSLLDEAAVIITPLADDKEEVNERTGD